MNEPSNLKELLIEDESLKLKPYLDTAKPPRLTIGVGRNLQDVGISAMEALFLLDNDIERVRLECRACFPWYGELSSVRRDVIANMVFNMGAKKVSAFHRMIEALSVYNFDLASEEMTNSKWALQVGQRAYRLARMMKTGKYDTTTPSGT